MTETLIRYLHIVVITAALVLSFYSGLTLGIIQGDGQGWQAATKEMNLPSASEIKHMAEVCR